MPDVSDEDFRTYAAQRRGPLRKAFAALIAGEAFAAPGERDNVMASLAGAVAGKWPTVPAERLASFFAASLAAMGVEPGAPDLAKVVNRIQSFQSRSASAAEVETRAVIPVSTDIEEMAARVVGVLADIPGIYSRGGKLTRVRPPEELPEGVLRGEAPPSFEILHPAVLQAIVSSRTVWIKETSHGPVKTLPMQQALQHVATVGTWDGAGRHYEHRELGF